MRNPMLFATTALSTAVLISASIWAAPAAAQQTPPTASEPTAVDDVVVTGSRIRLQDYVAPNPVTSVTEESIEASGTTNMASYLTEVPSLAATLTLEEGAETDTPSLAGLNLLNLRNLGADRTLVLVDGRRHVAGNPGTSSVDVNAIPVGMIERVEVLTGGASAVYGADGVSGVVNFILKKDFEGVDIRAQTGWSDKGGADNNFLSLIAGDNFADGRGNVTFGLEYNKDDRLLFSERRYTRTGNRFIFVSNPDDPGTFDPTADDPNLPDIILANNARYYDTSRVGSTYTNFFTAPTGAGVSFANDQPFVEGVSTGGFIALGGSGTPLDDFNDDLLPGLERGTLSFTGRYELTPRVTLFGELKYTRSDSQFTGQPSYFYGLFLHDENPFIPAVVLADARTPFGNATPEGAAAIGLPDLGVLLARDNFDLGSQSYDIMRETLRAVIGLEGQLTDRIDWELSLVHGRADQTTDASNVIINDRVFAATDVVVGPGGAPTCRSNLTPGAIPYGDLFAQFSFPDAAWGRTFTPGAGSGCLPLNLFGEGVNSAEAVDWVTGEYTSSAKIDQTVLSGFITGDTQDFLSLPAGPLGFALGFEYREESSDSRPSDIELLADSLEYPLTGLGRASRTQGSFDVREVFGEVTVPILRDLPFVKALDIGGAYRYSEYSTSGGAETWNINGRWEINDDFAIRATTARAVRAPSIVNLFQGRQQTFSDFADPCSVENQNIGDNPALRRQNCVTDLTALGVDPDSFINSSSEATGGFIQGNPDLQTETANTFTVGFVATPGFLPGFSLSLDYYDIEITDAIQSYTAQTIVNNCYDLPRPNQFCDLIERGTIGGNAGRLTSFNQIPGNIASYVTSGYDLTARYALDPADLGIQRDIGRFNFTLIANKLEDLTFVEASGADPDSDLNEIDAPEWTATFDVEWEFRDLTVNYGYSWFAETNRFTAETLASQPDYAESSLLKYDARSVHDLQVRYAVNGAMDVYAGVNNLTNQEPQNDEFLYPVSPHGRFFYVGLNARLGSLGDLVGLR